jgi:hypothetical protein
LPDVDFLTEQWIIDKSPSWYILSESVKRQEVVSIGLRILNVYLTPQYECRGIFRDVTTTKPNRGACQSIETALEKWIVSSKWKYFWPEAKISFIETLSILMKAANIRIQQYSGWEFEPWQTNILWTAISVGIIDSTASNPHTKEILRSDLFKITRRILLLNK